MTTTSSVVTSGTTSYISSTASGLDTDALIEAAVAQKTTRADTIDAKIDANEAKIAAYETLQGLLSDIGEALSGLAAPAYSALGASNSFDEKQAYLTASDGSDATSVIAVSADAEAAAASYAIEVEQLAKAMKVAATAQDKTTALGMSGVFAVGTGEASVEIEVTADMTLADLAEAIAAVSEETGVNATLIQVSSGSYQLVLSAADTNTEINASAVSGDDVLAAIGLTDGSGGFSQVLQAAQPAIVIIDGVEVTSDSNELTDVVDGLSISLLSTTAQGAGITLDVEADYEAVKTAITDFIDAYNALRDFVVTQQTVDGEGVVADDAVLFADTLLRSLTRALSSVLTGASASAAGEFDDLSDLGITFDSGNYLELTDETALDNALLSNLGDLESFFETSYEASDSRLKLLKNDTTRAYDFTLDVTVGEDGVITGATVDGQDGLFTVSGNRIVGAEGTIYEGLSFALTATADVSIDIAITPGFADQVVNLAAAYADTSGGLIQDQIDSLTELDTQLADRADRIRTDAESYREKLIAKYAAMETEVSAAQLLQQQIEAILNGNSSDDS
ncbi:MAG: flagellar filament capping protein FliD [Phenylobacterium sp.]|uniref:flagellar filament capping protein FliD n=1 Tax=Phenylobacterium sp. TaxID=1871053 RepID=UPI00391DAF3B